MIRENVIKTFGITLSMGCICTRPQWNEENIWNDMTLNFKVNGEGHECEHALEPSF